MPRIEIPADELAELIAAIRGVIEGDKFPHAPRLDPLRAALAWLDAAAVEPVLEPKVPSSTKGDRRGRR